LTLPSVNEIIISRWNVLSNEQNEWEIFSLICGVVKEIYEGGKRKGRIVWNFEIRFDWIWFNIIWFEIEFNWRSIFWNFILFNSPWIW